MKLIFLALFVLLGLAVIVALFNTLYHRLVIQRRQRKNERILRDLYAEAKQTVKPFPTILDKHAELGKAMDALGQKLADTGKSPARGAWGEPLTVMAPIDSKEVTHDMWCPKCGSRNKQERLFNNHLYQHCTDCGQNFHLSSEEIARRWDRNVAEKPTEAPSVDIPRSTDGHWPFVVTDETSPFMYIQDDTPIIFGGGGGGAGESYDPPSSSESSSYDSSSDSSSSYDSSSSDSYSSSSND